MFRSGWLAVLAVVLASLPCRAQPGFGGGEEKEYPVQVEMDGGQNVQGKLRLVAVLIACDLGEYRIKPEKVKLIRLSKSGAEAKNVVQAGPSVRGTLITTSDREIHGYVQIGGWTVETDIGSLTLNPETIRAVTFKANSPQPEGNDKKP